MGSGEFGNMQKKVLAWSPTSDCSNKVYKCFKRALAIVGVDLYLIVLKTNTAVILKEMCTSETNSEEYQAEKPHTRQTSSQCPLTMIVPCCYLLCSHIGSP